MKKLKAKHSFGNAETTSPRSEGLGGLSLAMLFALCLASCTSDTTVTDALQGGTATVSLSLTTRAGDGTQPWAQDDAITVKQGDKEMATLKYYADGTKWTADGTANGSSDFYVSLYRPLTATYPASAANGSFSIPTDQSNGIHSADLMQGENTPKAAGKSVDFKLDHKLAQIVITISDYVGYNTPPTISDVKITSIGSAMSLSDGKWTASNTTATEITPLTTEDTSGNGKHSFTAIVAPGTYSSGQTILKLTDTQSGESKGGTKTAKLQETVTLESGKSYAYTLKVENDKLTLSSASVTSWKTETNNVTSTASTYKDYYKTDLDKAEIGDYYMSDGYLYSRDLPSSFIKKTLSKNDEGIAQSDIVGIVFALASDAEYNDASTTDDAKYQYKNLGIGSNTIHGYVMAVKDAGEPVELIAHYPNSRRASAWSTEEVSIADVDKEDADSAKSWNGYKNTQAVLKYVEQNNKDLKSQYPAFYYICKNYEDSVSAPKTSSGWYMGASKQLQTAALSASIVKTNIERAGGSFFSDEYDYWTSSQYCKLDEYGKDFDSDDEAIRVRSASSYNRKLKNDAKSTGYKNRAILTF